MRPRITYANVAATAALVLAATGLAVASNPVLDGVVHGCIDKSTRLLEVPKTGKCSKGEKQLTWSKTGPRGRDGTNGTPGMSGYQIITGNTAAGADTDLVADSTATCPSGKKAVGGGFSTDGSNHDVNTVFSKPFGENQWIAQTAKKAAGGYTMTAYAVCVSVQQ